MCSSLFLVLPPGEVHGQATSTQRVTMTLHKLRISLLALLLPYYLPSMWGCIGKSVSSSNDNEIS
jgi:hypothetical protein